MRQSNDATQGISVKAFLENIDMLHREGCPVWLLLLCLPILFVVVLVVEIWVDSPLFPRR